jgi:cytochrome c oxidase assembly protein Cox11
MKPSPYIPAAILLLLVGLKLYRAEALPNFREPSLVTEGYLHAIDAKDDVHRYVSAADQRRVRIPVRFSLPHAPDLSVTLSRNEVVVEPGDLFEISMRVKNRSKQRVNARIDHVIEPRASANYLDLVECGFLVPVTLHPEIEQEYYATYLLRENIPADVHQLSLTYDFKLRRVLGVK